MKQASIIVHGVGSSRDEIIQKPLRTAVVSRGVTGIADVYKPVVTDDLDIGVCQFCVNVVTVLIAFICLAVVQKVLFAFFWVKSIFNGPT